jgi:hypothetical protein
VNEALHDAEFLLFYTEMHTFGPKTKEKAQASVKADQRMDAECERARESKES